MTTDNWNTGPIPRLDELQWAFIGLRGAGKAWGKFGRVVERWEHNGTVMVVAEYESTTPDVIEFTQRLRPAVSLADRCDGHIFLHDWKCHDMSVAELMRDHIPASKILPRYDQEHLVDDLQENGLRWPIIASEHGGRVIGSNRLRAAHKLGWDTIPCYVVPLTVKQMRGM